MSDVQPSPQPVDPMQRNIRITIVVGALVIVAAMAALIIQALSSLNATAADPCGTTAEERLQNIQQIGHFQFPSNAVNYQFQCFGTLGVSGSFELPPDELSGFITTTWINTELSADAVPTRELTAVLADGMDSYLYAIYEDETLSQEILIDTSNRLRYYVYITVVSG